MLPLPPTRRRTKGTRVYVALPGEGFGLPAALTTPLPRLPLAELPNDCKPPACREPLLPPAAPLPPTPLLVRQLLGCQLLGSSVLTPPALAPTALLPAAPAAAAPTGMPALLAVAGPTEAARLGAAETTPAAPPGISMSSTFAARSAAKPAAATCTAQAMGALTGCVRVLAACGGGNQGVG